MIDRNRLAGLGNPSTVPAMFWRDVTYGRVGDWSFAESWDSFKRLIEEGLSAFDQLRAGQSAIQVG